MTRHGVHSRNLIILLVCFSCKCGRNKRRASLESRAKKNPLRATLGKALNVTRGRETRRGADHATRVSLARETRTVDAGSSGDLTSHAESRRISRQTARGRGTAEVHAPHFLGDRLFPEASRAFFERAFDSREDRDDAPAAIKTRRTGPRERACRGRDDSRCGVSRCRRDARGAEETRGALQRVRRFPRV